jgi:hypothetical protein
VTAGHCSSRRVRDAAGWLVPAAILAALPKCPACLAIYVAMGTGVGLSLTAASYLRMAIVVVSLASLAYIATKQWRLHRQRPNTPRLASEQRQAVGF